MPGIHKLTLKIVGIVHKPVFFSQHTATIYLPIETLQHFAGEDNPPMVSSININLKEKANFEAFQQKWNARILQVDPNLRLRAPPPDIRRTRKKSSRRPDRQLSQRDDLHAHRHVHHLLRPEHGSQ